MFLEAALNKKFPEFEVGVRIDASRGEFVTLLGPSGSGKTTILQMLAGIIPPNGSQILLDGKDVSNMPAEKRNFGMVFQEKLLFPHLNVFENVAFGLKMRKMDMKFADEALKAVGMEKFARRNINSLSGGERQRVAIARAIAYHPTLLLLDEPLKELDAVAKERIRQEMKNLQKQLKITTIYVTHDVEEAFYLSDRVYVLHAGRVMQEGTPLGIFKKPANEFVRRYFSPYLLIGAKGGFAIARKASIAFSNHRNK
ncbi:MAG: ABC transporter ATP-binding protein [Candidatus Micrarchaeota archaeon]